MTAAEQFISQLEMAESFVERAYLSNLRNLPTVEQDEHALNPKHIRLFQLDRIVYDAEESIEQKLFTTLSSLQIFSVNVLLIIHGQKTQASLYLGIQSDERSLHDLEMILHAGFEGNFPGSRLRALEEEERRSLLAYEFESASLLDKRAVTCVNVLPSEREKKARMTTQGLEKLIDTMKGQEYYGQIIVTPVRDEQLRARARALEELYSSVSAFAKTSVSNGSNEGLTISSSLARSITETISDSAANTTGKIGTHSEGKNHGFNSGVPLLAAFSLSQGSMASDAESGMWNATMTRSTSQTSGDTYTDSRSKTIGQSHHTTIEHINKTAQNMLERIDRHLKRMEASRAFGLWECSAYFIAPFTYTACAAAGAFRALLTGEETSAEDAYINLIQSDLHVERILTSLAHGKQPMFRYGRETITATNYVSGKELPFVFCLPRKSVPGIGVLSIAEFARSVMYAGDHAAKSESLEIGHVFHMGSVQRNRISLDMNELTSHCFITGTTGSGKSNTVYVLLQALFRKGIPFLVVEPAKGEYKRQFGAMEGINVFSTTSSCAELLKMNPFRVAPGVHVLEHLDRLIEIFNNCWEMYAAMPALLKEAMERAYEHAGWDLVHSVYTGEGAPRFPTFQDLLRELPKLISESGYSAETKGDYTGALVTRVTSLTNGLYGRIFCNENDIEDARLFDETSIVDLSRIGSQETKALIMGVLILRLTEYRMIMARESNAQLRHVTVLEEAHHILRNAAALQGSAAAALIHKSVEMISNSIAEMRTYGEGFIIVDQSPHAVDDAAIRNTNTKLIMRLPDLEDCTRAGHSIALSDAQTAELSRLPRGVAAVMQSGWLESVLVQMPPAETADSWSADVSPEEMIAYRSDVLREAIEQYCLRKQPDHQRVYERIKKGRTGEGKAMLAAAKRLEKTLEAGRSNAAIGKALCDMAGCRELFGLAERKYDLKKKGTACGGEWYRYIRRALGRYVSLDEAQLKMLIRYVVYALAGEEKDGVYAALYRQLD